VRPQAVRSFDYGYGPVTGEPAYITIQDQTGAAYYSGQ